MKDVNKFSTPIDKTAALVVNQSGCDKQTRFLTAKKKMEDLKRSVQSLLAMQKLVSDKKEKKEIGRRIANINKQISTLKETVKMHNMIRRETMNSLIIRECMNRFSEREWDEIVREADIKFRAREI